jgi:hypothetical protein
MDVEHKTIRFSYAEFERQLDEYSRKMDDPAFFSLAGPSLTYRCFLEKGLEDFAAIRGQVIGPVSYGFRITDENDVPIIYNEQVRAFLFDFLQRKINAQYQELNRRNQNAFVWLDEPGLGWVFSGFSGFSDVAARKEYREFLSGLDGMGALHLCATVNLPYLLNLGVSLLSFDAYKLEFIPKGYVQEIAGFISRSGIISWGIVPTDSLSLDKETPQSLTERLLWYWQVITENSGIPTRRIAEQALLAPARCCLKNNIERETITESRMVSGEEYDATPEELMVETAFKYLKNVSSNLKKHLRLT